MGAVLSAATVSLCMVAFRRLRHIRKGGIEVALRVSPDHSIRGWHVGVGHYRGDEFAWYRIFSIRSGPDRLITRSEVEITGRREVTGPESYSVPSGARVLRCTSSLGEFELAMEDDALTGFLSWLESAPPGQSVPFAS
ncbi:DUF2550 family protein [Pseudonocardiaceae bacterium YIM PH 21723]|nr:DUF2550 family protein [Pseudonocardiaceae bacterium YIM PH 21723]